MSSHAAEWRCSRDSPECLLKGGPGISGCTGADFGNDTTMKFAIAIALLALGVTGPAFAATEVDEVGDTSGLILRCDAYGDRAIGAEIISITELKPGDAAEPASTVRFQKSATRQAAVLAVKIGEKAECIFPSGIQVRVKVGEGHGSAYGFCGGSPEVFGSVWLNERKIASQFWFSGHCREQDGYPEPSFKIEGGPAPAVQKCHTARPLPNDDITDAGNSAAPASTGDPLIVCVDFPELSRYPRDEREYPAPGKTPPKPGSIELLAGSDKVCDAVQRELTADFATFGRYADQASMTLKRPDWGKPSAALPEHVNEEDESLFDFDNDGMFDSVRSVGSETRYMNAIGLIVAFGTSSKTLEVLDATMDAGKMNIPCQMDVVHHDFSDCPPNTQNADEAGFAMKAGTERSVFFRARYSMVAPFEFRGSNFIGVAGQGEAEEYVAVLRPMPKREFRQMCLFRRVTENF